MAYALAHPTHGPQRIADELGGERYGGLRVARMSVWRLLRRLGLGTRARRLAALEGFALGEQGLLCERRARRVVRHIEAQRPGELICLDSFYVGNLKGVGRIWQLTAIDAFSALGWAALCVGELPQAVVGLLAERVLPDCAAAGHRLERVLTDNGNEYRSAVLADFLKAHGIAQRRTRVGRPQSNGFVERLQGTILHEFYRVAFRRQRYTARWPACRPISRPSSTTTTPSEPITATAPRAGARSSSLKQEPATADVASSHTTFSPRLRPTLALV